MVCCRGLRDLLECLGVCCSDSCLICYLPYDNNDNDDSDNGIYVARRKSALGDSLSYLSNMVKVDASKLGLVDSITLVMLTNPCPSVS